MLYGKGYHLKKSDKKITLSIQKIKQEFIQIIIEDNGIGRKASAKIKSEKSINRKSIGINLTKNRLAIFEKEFKNKYVIIYEDLMSNNVVKGTKVTLDIPII